MKAYVYILPFHTIIHKLSLPFQISKARHVGAKVLGELKVFAFCSKINQLTSWKKIYLKIIDTNKKSNRLKLDQGFSIYKKVYFFIC